MTFEICESCCICKWSSEVDASLPLLTSILRQLRGVDHHSHPFLFFTLLISLLVRPYSPVPEQAWVRAADVSPYHMATWILAGAWVTQVESGMCIMWCTLVPNIDILFLHESMCQSEHSGQRTVCSVKTSGCHVSIFLIFSLPLSHLQESSSFQLLPWHRSERPGINLLPFWVVPSRHQHCVRAQLEHCRKQQFG